jgi:hypothetical protein
MHQVSLFCARIYVGVCVGVRVCVCVCVQVYIMGILHACVVYSTDLVRQVTLVNTAAVGNQVARDDPLEPRTGYDEVNVRARRVCRRVAGSAPIIKLV